MIQITKIFHFEMAHAINNYSGACKNIHGHSYELHVTINSTIDEDEYIPAPGFVIDFKELKQLINSSIIQKLDHSLILSRAFISDNNISELKFQENLVVWDIEPSVENLLVFIRKTLSIKLPATLKLFKLKLYETRDSYAEWFETNNIMV